MSTSISELYQLDSILAYQQGFLYIRQLSLHLRHAILKKSAETTRQITNWTYINCIRLWTRILCIITDLKPLLYPLVQIITGLLSFLTSNYYLPLKFHLITYCHQLSAYCQTYIPISLKIMEILDINELFVKSLPSTEIAPNLLYLLKYSNDSLLKNHIRDQIMTQFMIVLRHNIEIYRYHSSIPEYLYLIQKKLRIFIKKCKIIKWREQLRNLIGLIDQYSNYGKINRLKLNLLPSQIIDFESLLPNSSMNAAVRLTKLLNNSSNFSMTIDEGSNTKKVEKKNEETIIVKKLKKNQNKTKVSKVNIINDDENDQEDKVTSFQWSDDES